MLPDWVAQSRAERANEIWCCFEVAVVSYLRCIAAWPRAEHFTMDSTTQEPKKLGRFEVVRALGSGAFGTVYLARDPQLERSVALKVPGIRTRLAKNEEERFLREARAAAALHHPNIVAVHDAGRIDDEYYIASAFIDGGSIRDFIRDQGQPSARTAVRLVASLADALGYAHEKGIVHRDVKPENILLDRNGTPYLADFGLAVRPAEVSDDKKRSLAGTPAYMSPEQVASSTIDGRTDQWALGVTLYELLTGQRPFRGSQASILAAISQGVVQSPRTLVPDLHPDLEAICLKCLSQSPSDRYADCYALARDLNAWLADEPVMARPLNSFQRFAHWRKREPIIAHLISLFLTVVGLFSVALLVLLLRANSMRSRAEAEAQRATDSAALATAQAKELESRRAAAQTAKEKLESTMTELGSTYEKLNKSYAELQSREAELRRSYDDLNNARKTAERAEQATAVELEKNKSLRYFGNMEGVRLALQAGETDLAKRSLAETPQASRSIEWKLLNTIAARQKANFSLVTNYAAMAPEVKRFIRAIHFPESVNERLHLNDVIASDQIVAMSNDGQRWVCRDRETKELLGSQLPRMRLATKDARYPNGPTLVVPRYRILTTGGNPILRSEYALNCWLSPDGNRACLILPEFNTQMKDKLNSELTIRYRLQLIDLDDKTKQVELRMKEPMTKVISMRVVGANADSYTAEIPDLTTYFDGGFTQDSQHFVLLDGIGSNLIAWNSSDIAYQEKVREATKESHLSIEREPRVTCSAMRFDDGQMYLCTSKELLKLTVPELKVEQATPLPDADVTARAIAFSRSGKYVVRMSSSQAGGTSSIELKVTGIDGSKKLTAPVSLEQYAACRDFFGPFSDANVRIKFFGMGVLTPDWGNLDFVDNDDGNWLSFQLPDSVQLFFERDIRTDIESEVLWRHIKRVPTVLKYSDRIQSLLVAFPDRLFVLKPNDDEKWVARFSKSVDGEPILDATIHSADDAVVFAQPTHVTICDLGKSDSLSSFKLPFGSSLNFITDRRMAFLNSTGDVVVCTKDGTVTEEFRGNRIGGRVMVVDPQNRLMAIASADGKMGVWSVTESRMLTSRVMSSPTRSMNLNLRTKMLTSLGVDGSISLYDWPSLRRLARFDTAQEEVLLAHPTNDGKRLIVITERELQIYDIQYAMRILQVTRFASPAQKAELLSDQSAIFIYNADGELIRYTL